MLTKLRFPAVTAALVATLVPMTAISGQPEFGEWTDTDIAYTSDCGDYIQVEEHYISVREKWMFDDNGYPVSLQWHLTGEIRLYDEDYPEDYVAGTARTNQFARWDEGDFLGFAINGIRYKFDFPGQGVVFLWVGRYEFDSDFNFTMHHGTTRNTLSNDAWCELTRH